MKLTFHINNILAPQSCSLYMDTDQDEIVPLQISSMVYLF